MVKSPHLYTVKVEYDQLCMYVCILVKTVSIGQESLKVDLRNDKCVKFQQGGFPNFCLLSNKFIFEVISD